MRNRGFTLIELIIAVGIIITLSVAAINGTRALMASLRHGNAFNKIVFLVQQARASALTGTNPDYNGFGVRFDIYNQIITQFGKTATAETALENAAIGANNTLKFTMAAGAAIGAPGVECIQATVLFVKGVTEATFTCDGAGDANKNPSLLRFTLTGEGNRQKSFSIHAASGIPQVQ